MNASLKIELSHLNETSNISPDELHYLYDLFYSQNIHFNARLHIPLILAQARVAEQEARVSFAVLKEQLRVAEAELENLKKKNEQILILTVRLLPPFVFSSFSLGFLDTQ